MSVIAVPHAVSVRAAITVSSAVERVSESVPRMLGFRSRAVTNNAAPLMLIAVIAVAAAVALIVVVGLAAAWLYFCTSTYPGSWPAVGVPSKDNSFYYFGCMVPR